MGKDPSSGKGVAAPCIVLVRHEGLTKLLTGNVTLTTLMRNSGSTKKKRTVVDILNSCNFARREKSCNKFLRDREGEEL